MNQEFITPEMLATFAGLVAATNIIVQFSKKPIKNKWGDAAVRIYSFIISFILIAAFIGPQGKSVGQSIILILINAIVVTLTALGSYESIADPKAEKKK
jgi:hypothetical protein